VEACTATYRLNRVDRAAQAAEHFDRVITRLHRDDAHLVLLVHPHQERLASIVEDAAALCKFTTRLSTSNSSAAA
jgi:hypothetical protein